MNCMKAPAALPLICIRILFQKLLVALLKLLVGAAALLEEVPACGLGSALLLLVADLLDAVLGRAFLPKEPGNGRMLPVSTDLATLVASPDHGSHIAFQVRQGCSALIIQAPQLFRHIIWGRGLANNFGTAALAHCHCRVVRLCRQRLLRQICRPHSRTGSAELPTPLGTPPPQVFGQFAALRRRQAGAVVDLGASLHAAVDLEASAYTGPIIKLALPIGRKLLL